MHAPDLPKAQDAGRRYALTRGFYAPYFVYDREAAEEDALPVLLAVSSAAAVEEAAAGVGLTWSTPLFATQFEATDPDRMGDPWRVVCLTDGRRLLIGRGQWPDEHVFSHGALWACLPEELRAALHVQWDAVHWQREASSRYDAPSGLPGRQR